MWYTSTPMVKSLLFVCLSAISVGIFAHGVDDSTRQFLLNNQGVSIIPYVYIGAKHMVTGYDHLLFLVGVIFFLYRTKDVIVYVTFFTLGHSITLLFGVLNNIAVNPYLIDAVIGFSIVYKGLDNLGCFKHLFGSQPNAKLAVLVFGLFHGFGLATKLQEYEISQEGLLANLIAFNLGVELGQFLVLTLVVIAFVFWRRHPSFLRFSTATNSLLICAGVLLTGFQLSGYMETASSGGQAVTRNYRTDTVDIVVPAGKGLEYKLFIAKDANIRYAWKTKNGGLYFDFHGEPKGDTTGYFESYTISTASDVRGSLFAPFDGSHGWYWKNNGSQAILVSLRIEGNYEILGMK